jgi:hypothetical protein
MKYSCSPILSIINEKLVSTFTELWGFTPDNLDTWYSRNTLLLFISVDIKQQSINHYLYFSVFLEKQEVENIDFSSLVSTFTELWGFTPDNLDTWYSRNTALMKTLLLAGYRNEISR